MRILCTNDDGIHAPGLKTLEAIARSSVGRCLGRRARDRPERRLAFAVAQRSLAPARDLRPAFRREGHADRLRHHGRAPPHAARHRPDLVLSGVNRGPERRRGRDLFRHGRGRHRGHDPRRSVDRAVAGLRRRQTRNAPRWQCAEHHGPQVIRKILEAGIDRGILVNVNFPDCEPDEVEGTAARQPGPAHAGTPAPRRAPGRARQSLLTGSPSSAAPSRPATAPTSGPSPTGASPSRRCALDMTDEPTLTRYAQAFG